MVSEQILEVRFKPNPRMLDRRGRWAQDVARELSFDHWSIIDNRVDLFPQDKRTNAFISFRNFGLSAFDAPTDNYFRDKASKFLSAVVDLPDFDTPLELERFGVRHKVCEPLDASLEKIASVIRDVFIQTGPLDKIGGSNNVVDAGVLAYFRTAHGQLNIRLTSNDEKQLKLMFPNFPGTLPAQGWACDIDYYTEKREQIAKRDLVRRLVEFSTEIEARRKAVAALLPF